MEAGCTDPIAPAFEHTAPTRRVDASSVLLVDDDCELLETLSFCFACAGLKVAIAHDLPEAMHQLDQSPPQVAVLDMQIGSWSGLDLLVHLRKRSRVPVVMLTGSDSARVRERCMELGASAFFAKPVSVRVLVACL